MIVFAGIATLLAGLLTAFVYYANGQKTSGEFIGGGFIAISWMVVVVLWLIAAWPAHAHDHNRPELNDWLAGLHSKVGAWCCVGDDTDAIEDWETKGDHYRVKFRGEWYDVPDGAVVDGPNKSGAPLLWMNRGYSGVSVRCFMAGPLI